MSGNQQLQGQQNTLSAFGFKPADTSNATNPSPHNNTAFGGFGSTSSPFGGTNAAQNNATSTGKSGDNIFGSAQNPTQGSNQPSPAPPSGGIFGSSSGSQPGNLFDNAPKFGTNGGPPAPVASNANSLFGGPAAQPTASSTKPSSAFARASINQAAPTGRLFGSASGGQPVQTGISSGVGSMGSSGTSGANIFGNTPKRASTGGPSGATGSNDALSTANTLQPALSIFGASNNNQPSSTQTGGSSGTLNTSTNPSVSNPQFSNAPDGAVASTPSQSTKPADVSHPGISATASASDQTTSQSLFGNKDTAIKSSTVALPGTATPTAASSSFPSLFANLPKKSETAAAPGSSSTTPSLSAFASLTAQKDATRNGDKDTKTDATLLTAVGLKDGAEDVPNTSSPFVGFSTGNIKDASASKPATASADAGATPASSAAAPIVTAVPAPSMLRGKTVEDIVNRWTTELEAHTREFSQFASEVAVWDRTLIENGNYKTYFTPDQISALYATVLAAESTQMSLDQSLDHVEQQQRHLTATLDQYEKSASEILHGPGGIMTSTEGLGLADSERDKSYAMAANLYTQLDDLSRSLTQMVESVNNLNLSPGPSHGSDDGPKEDAISTIAGILNAHLASLQWIDGALNEMDSKVKDAERKIKDSSMVGGPRRDGMNKSRSYGLGSPRR